MSEQNPTHHFFLQVIRLFRLDVLFIRRIIRPVQRIIIRRHVVDAVLRLQVTLQVGHETEGERRALRTDQVEDVAAYAS